MDTRHKYTPVCDEVIPAVCGTHNCTHGPLHCVQCVQVHPLYLPPSDTDASHWGWERPGRSSSTASSEPVLGGEKNS